MADRDARPPSLNTMNGLVGAVIVVILALAVGVWLLNREVDQGREPSKSPSTTTLPPSGSPPSK